MNPANLKKIIESMSGLLTGLVSSFILYNHETLGISEKNKDNIPVIVGFVILLIMLLLIFLNKRKIDGKIKVKTKEYKEELASKIKIY